jgi:signal transduction histidine kinase
LHIARRLIESMGGKIWLDISSSPGALFRLTVPAVRGDATAAVGDVTGQVRM